MGRIWALWGALGLVAPIGVLAQPPATTQDTTRADRSERHDGFLCRLSLGYGYGTLEDETSSDPAGATRVDARMGDPVAVEGIGLGFALDLGGALSDSLSIFGRVAVQAMHNGRALRDTTVKHGDLDLLAAGVSYFFMPFNAHLSAALGLAHLRVHGTGELGDSYRGFGGTLDLGKEWWVDDDWGLGATLRGAVAWAPRSPSGLTAMSLQLAFTATYQ